MKLVPIIAAAIGIFASASAFSAGVTVDFEGVTSFSSVDQFYNGGADGEGAVGPNNYGISFSGSALGMVNDGTGAGEPDGHFFSNQPSGTTVMFAPDVPTVMSVASGFVGTVSFYYSNVLSTLSPTTVTVRDANGFAIGSTTLAANADGQASWDTWSLASINLTGVGQTVTFDNNGGFIAYDDVTVNAVPLPAALLLLPFGAAGLGAVARRRKSGKSVTSAV